MTLRQRALKYFVTAVIGCLLLALIVWMVRNLGRREGYHTITLDDPAARKMAVQAERERARREARWLAMRYPEAATVPWSRDAVNPEPARVALAGQPFADRHAIRPLPVYVYVARFRPFGKRYSLKSPDPVKLPMAEVPWNGPRRPRRPATLEPARLPNLPRMRDLRKPDEVTIAVAGVPWGRDAGRPEAAHVEEARISSRLRTLLPAKPGD